MMDPITYLVIYVMAGAQVVSVNVTEMPLMVTCEQIGAQTVQDHPNLVFECLQDG